MHDPKDLERAAAIPAAVADAYEATRAAYWKARDALLFADGVEYRCHGPGYHWLYMRRVGRRWVEVNAEQESVNISCRVATVRARNRAKK